MPKQVDHDARREELAAALWHVVTREGIEAASIRRVAAEANCSTGSLRHYYDAHASLRGLCEAAAGERGDELHALVDGLALHGVLAPDLTPPDRQLELLREQLERAGGPSPR